MYNNVRGAAQVVFGTGISNIVGYTPTDLGTIPYSFTIAVDGGTTYTIPITITYTNDTVTAVDTVNNAWSVGTSPLNTYTQYQQFEVTGNTGLVSTQHYTIKNVVTTGTATILYTNETISPSATADGEIHFPFTYDNLTDAVQSAIQAAHPSRSYSAPHSCFK